MENDAEVLLFESVSYSYRACVDTVVIPRQLQSYHTDTTLPYS